MYRCNRNFYRELFMPSGNGTGPFGFGPGTGRGRGRCRSNFPSPVGFRPRGRGLFGVIIPIAVALVRDLSNSNGLLRSFGRKVLERKPTAFTKPVDASYTVIDDAKSKR